MRRSHAIARHSSIIEGHYKLVGHILIGEAKSTIKNKGQITKIRRNWMRPRQLQWYANKFWGLVKS